MNRDEDYPVAVLCEERDWLMHHHPGPANDGRIHALRRAIETLRNAPVQAVPATGLCSYCGYPANSSTCQRSHP